MNLRERVERARANLGLGTLGQLAQAAVAAGIAPRRRADRWRGGDPHRTLTAREVTRAAPRRRPLRRRVEKLGELYRELEASVYDAHAIATGVVRLAGSEQPVPRQAVAAIEAAADSVRAIEPDAAREAATAARAAARALREADSSLGAGVIAHGVVGVADHTLRAARAREEERRLAEPRLRRTPFR